MPSITSVWPALWPPWKRTTMSACSESQSTILPLPSSPHCEPTTTTFAMAFPYLRRPSGALPANALGVSNTRLRRLLLLELQQLCLLHLRQGLHLGEHVGRHVSVDL